MSPSLCLVVVEEIYDVGAIKCSKRTRIITIGLGDVRELYWNVLAGCCVVSNSLASEKQNERTEKRKKKITLYGLLPWGENKFGTANMFSVSSIGGGAVLPKQPSLMVATFAHFSLSE